MNSEDALFSEARAYERFMGRWSRILAPSFVRFAGVRDGDAVLDVGSATGALASALGTAAPSSRIVGLDKSGAYVALAQSRHASASIRFETGDAQQLPFDSASFDRALSQLVLNFIPDVRRAIGEMKRVTRPGGTVAAAVWDYDGGMEMLRVFWDEAVAQDPSVDSKDERHMPLCRPGELAALWREHDLAGIVEEPITIDTLFASFDDYWQPFLDRQGPAGFYAASLAPAEREALRMRLRARLLGGRAGEGAGPIALKARAWAVRGSVR